MTLSHRSAVCGLLLSLTAVGCQPAFQSGFNDVSGINGDGQADHFPFNTGGVSIDGQGAGEEGWEAPWFLSTGTATVQSTTKFEGDGAAAFFNNTAAADRKLETPLLEPFSIETRIMIPGTITRDVIFRVYDSALQQNIVNAIAVQWAVFSDRSFRVLDGAGDTSGVTEDTGLKLTPGVWHKVTIHVDPTAKTWTFAVDGTKYDAPDPLGFRGAPVNLDSVQFLNEIAAPDGSYLDAVVVKPKPRHRWNPLNAFLIQQ